jgi:hypothetical protein
MDRTVSSGALWEVGASTLVGLIALSCYSFEFNLSAG